MNYAHNKNIKKKPVNLSLSEDLIAEAKRQKINLSAKVDEFLRHEFAAQRNRDFCKKYKDEITEMREEAQDFGLYSDKYGLF